MTLVIVALITSVVFGDAPDRIVDPSPESRGSSGSLFDQLQNYSVSGKGGPIYNASFECGTSSQRVCQPENFGGRTMCGVGVKKAIACMAKNVLNSPNAAKCTGQCGNGKDFVDCSNGQLTACGYIKVDPSSPRCLQAGAVRSYYKTDTRRGRVWGHVEFVCGSYFCSVYSSPLDHPWPKQIPDGCWIPDLSGGAK